MSREIVRECVTKEMDAALILKECMVTYRFCAKAFCDWDQNQIRQSRSILMRVIQAIKYSLVPRPMQALVHSLGLRLESS